MKIAFVREGRIKTFLKDAHKINGHTFYRRNAPSRVMSIAIFW